MNDLEKDKVITCEFCGEYQGTDSQVKGHKITCSMNPNARESAKAPVEEPPAPEEQAEVVTPQSEPIEEPSPIRPRETSDRKKRIPLGVRKKTWDTPEEDGFHYRVFNDDWKGHDPSRIQRALDAGYEIVEDVSRKTVGTNEDGSPITGI